MTQCLNPWGLACLIWCSDCQPPRSYPKKLTGIAADNLPRRCLPACLGVIELRGSRRYSPAWKLPAACPGVATYLSASGCFSQLTMRPTRRSSAWKASMSEAEGGPPAAAGAEEAPEGAEADEPASGFAYEAAV